jgi:hypothetical protein
MVRGKIDKTSPPLPKKVAVVWKVLTIIGAQLSWLERYLDTLLWSTTPNNLEAVRDLRSTPKYG